MSIPAYSTRTFQIWLNWLPAVSPKIHEDGVMGPETARAIRQAQAGAGLPQTGTITAEIADYVYGYFVAVTGGINLTASFLATTQGQRETAARTAAQARNAVNLLGSAISAGGGYNNAYGVYAPQPPGISTGTLLLIGGAFLFVAFVLND